jgi:hypothetical protein
LALLLACRIWAWDADNVTIRNCSSHDNLSQNNDGGGFDLDTGVTNSVVEYCTSYNNYGMHIYSTAARRTRIVPYLLNNEAITWISLQYCQQERKQQQDLFAVHYSWMSLSSCIELCAYDDPAALACCDISLQVLGTKLVTSKA